MPWENTIIYEAHVKGLTRQREDVPPEARGLFGGLACFRGCKSEYAQVMTKAALFALWDQRTEFVQETFLCPEFALRRRGAGYRG